MLRLYSDVRVMQVEVRGVCEAVRAHDANLASQLRRAAQSVALNLAEGMAAQGGSRRQAFGNRATGPTMLERSRESSPARLKRTTL